MPARMLRLKASTVRVLVLLATFATAAAACFEIEGFECGSDDACTRDGTAGRCEAEGVCAYPSESCPSQWRYSPNAGSLADVCVPQGASASTMNPEASTGAVGSSSESGAPNSGTDSETEAPPQPTCSGCQSFATNGRTFFVCAETSTWFDARDACSECGLELASVRTDAENQALTQRVPVTIQLWIGLNDTEIEGDWRWEDDAELSFEPWAEGQPSVLPEDDCAVLVSSGEWSAKRCGLANPYACAVP